MTRVAICERTTLFRDALAALVASQGHEVVCCAGSLEQVVAAAARSDPDVLLLGACVAEPRVLGELRARRDGGPARRIFLLADSADDGWADEVVARGLADGVFDQAVALASQERAVNGEAGAVPPGRRTTVPPRSASSLTAREREVLALLSAGRSTPVIADALGVGPSTVHSHVQSIMQKLDAHSRLQAVSIYLGQASLCRRMQG